MATVAYAALAVVLAIVVAVLILRAKRLTNDIARLDSRTRELKQALDQARENEATMRLALDAASEFLWDGDLVTGKVTGSDQAGDWLGYGPAEWPPDPWDKIVHEDDRVMVHHAIGQAIRGKTRTYRVRHRLRHKDGSVLHAVSTGVVIRDASGNATRFVGFVRDVSREHEEETHRLQAQKLEGLGLLAGGIAHDFNNVLTAITASVELAKQATGASEHLDTALVAVERAAALTRQLLAYAGRTPIVHAPINLNELVESMAALLALSITRKVILQRSLAPTLPSVLGDSGQLQQVVMNLITNAAEAIGDREGTIMLRTEAGGTPSAPTARLIVTDSGPGMTQTVQARIFDPFFSTKGIGRGLGLASITGILKSHAGSILVDSKVGAGTTFVVEFPATAVPLPENVPNGPGPATVALRVLLVDDELIVRKPTRRLLERLGYTVDDAENGVQAVERVRASPRAWDVVLMDVMMPQMNGTEAAARIREFAPSLPIVLTSGYSTEPHATGECLYFIAKPYSVEELEATLAKACAH